ncbi:hypothetical protein [Anditalea andensis]|uniref:Uncharacterized protein n=1 Tax=Anditalea andensis TaxID=1048983 RepID=A0A074L697_9BACT|nr:hypothetical protein [Anditalea andensis]KEO75363.1 hypothetical protein EL17_02155 [Anditalea andensis]
MEIFLKAKHWQIFLFIVGIPILIELLDTIIIIAGKGEEFTFRAVLRFLLIIPFLTFYFWIYSVGYLLNKKIKGKLNTKSGYFGLAVWTSAFSLFFLSIFVFFIWDDWEQLMIENNFTYVIFGVVVFLALATLLTALSFIAKTLVRAERNAEVNSSDFYGEFVMTLFFPIGIWILQPRINKIYAK